MKIAQRFENGSGTPVVSFEFFPPRDEAAESQLDKAISRLRRLGPSFVSVTYGAGGSTRDKTVQLVGRIRREHGIEAMAHLTCVGSPREEIAAVLDRLREQGVENVLALRGDPPRGSDKFEKPVGGFGYASELVAFIREHSGETFCVGGACYPEGHLEAASLEQDLDHLGRKVEAGAEFLITQLFFDPNVYFEFVQRAHGCGITVPIVPGLMPITNLDQVERFTSMCGATIPEALHQRLQAVRDEPNAVRQIGLEHAIEQSSALLRGGAPGLHFYTLNRSPATRAIFEELGRRGLVRAASQDSTS